MVQIPSEDNVSDSLVSDQTSCAFLTANKMRFEGKDFLDILTACLCACSWLKLDHDFQLQLQHFQKTVKHHCVVNKPSIANDFDVYDLLMFLIWVKGQTCNFVEHYFIQKYRDEQSRLSVFVTWAGTSWTFATSVSRLCDSFLGTFEVQRHCFELINRFTLLTEMSCFIYLFFYVKQTLKLLILSRIGGMCLFPCH